MECEIASAIVVVVVFRLSDYFCCDLVPRALSKFTKGTNIEKKSNASRDDRVSVLPYRLDRYFSKRG